MALPVKAKHRMRSDLDSWVIPNFAQECSFFGFDPAKLQRDLESHYPVAGRDEEIAPCKAQWADGANEAWTYRGHEMKRSKMRASAASARAEYEAELQFRADTRESRSVL